MLRKLVWNGSKSSKEEIIIICHPEYVDTFFRGSKQAIYRILYVSLITVLFNDDKRIKADCSIETFEEKVKKAA